MSENPEPDCCPIQPYAVVGTKRTTRHQNSRTMAPAAATPFAFLATTTCTASAGDALLAQGNAIRKQHGSPPYKHLGAAHQKCTAAEAKAGREVRQTPRILYQVWRTRERGSWRCQVQVRALRPSMVQSQCKTSKCCTHNGPKAGLDAPCEFRNSRARAPPKPYPDPGSRESRNEPGFPD
jgi:hypothetical protein